MLAAHALALKALQRPAEALAYEERATRDFPSSGVAWHNLATTLEALGRSAEAHEAIDHALSLGLDKPETWLVKAHVALSAGDFDAARAAYGKVLERAPDSGGAAEEYAKLLWVSTGDWRRAIAPLHAARRAGDRNLESLLFEVKVLESAGQRKPLRQLFDDALQAAPDDFVLLRAAAHAALEDDELDRASALAERTLQKSPRYVPGLIELTAVRLAQGRAEDAFNAARAATQIAPLDQSTWGWLATAGRAVGHPIFESLHDYDALVRAYTIETPAGWPSLDAYLADLEQTLRALHLSNFEPADQSLRNGTQTHVDLLKSDMPVLKAFFTALDAPIRAYMRETGTGRDPLRSRTTGNYQIQSAWSVLLKPNGFHVSHYHPMGWISSAFYVRVPESAMDGDDRQGWIKFGEPPFKTDPPQPPAHFVRPQPGRLVLFPSYMWHGTVPFTTEESRLTIAFDVLPA